MSNFRPAENVPARNDSEAWDRFTRFAGPALRSLDKHSQWIQSTPPQRGHVAIPVPEPVLTVKRRNGLPPLYVTPSIEFEYVDDDREPGRARKLSTLGYSHTVATEKDSGTIFRWEWHPDNPNYPFTHMHVVSSEQFPDAGVPLKKLHLATSRVSLEQIVFFLVRDLDVVIDSEDDFDQLRESQLTHEHHRSWQGSGPAPT